MFGIDKYTIDDSTLLRGFYVHTDDFVSFKRWRKMIDTDTAYISEDTHNKPLLIIIMGVERGGRTF